MQGATPPELPGCRGGGDAAARLGSRPVHRGRVVDLSIDRVRFPDGTEGELEMIRHSGAAAVLPLAPGAGGRAEVVLIRQYRYAAGGYLLEAPAGRPAYPGEPWEECARRELEEETGLIAGTLKPLSCIWTTPGFTDERIHLFLATDLSQGTVARDADEFLEVVRCPLDKALTMVRRGEIRDAKTVCALLLSAAADLTF